MGNFFIGIGPIVLGTAVIYLLSYWLSGLNPFNLVNTDIASSQFNSWGGLTQLFRHLWNSSGILLSEVISWQHLSSWQLYVFIYLVFAIGSSMTLSLPDIKGAWDGFVVISGLAFIFNLVTIWAGNFTSNVIMGIAGYYVLFYVVIFLIMIINAAVALLVFLPLSLLRVSHSKAA